MAERWRNYLDREDSPLSTIDGRTGADRLLDRLRAEYQEPRVDTAPQLLCHKKGAGRIARAVVVRCPQCATPKQEALMRKPTMILTATALLLMAFQASAQNQHRGAAQIHALKNATPLVTPVACYGGTGYCGCGPGWITSCAPRCCRCVPCWR